MSTNEPLLCAFLTSGHGELVRQLLRSTGDAVEVVAVIRDRPSAIDDKGVPTRLRRGPTQELLAELGIQLVDCYLPKRGGDKAARLILQEENILFELGNAGVQLLVLVEYERELVPDGPLLKRYGAGQLLSIYPTMLAVVSKGPDGAAIFRSHAQVSPDDTLESLLRTFEAVLPPGDTRPSADRRWTATASSFGFDSEAAMWQKLYIEKALSFKELSDLLDAAIITIRTRIVLAGIPVRSRGGANRIGERLTEAETDGIIAEGIAKAAKRLGVSYGAMYYRVQRVILRRQREAKKAKHTE